MAGELKTQFTSGATVYAVVLNGAGQAWRTDSSVFEPPTAGDWTHYAVTMIEQSTTGVYAGNFPTAITTAGAYPILFRQQSGGSPAATDQNNGMLGGLVCWTGAAEAFPLASSAANAANVGMNGANLDANMLQIAGQTASAAGAVTFPGSIGTSTFSGGNLNVTQIGGQAVSLDTNNLLRVDAAGWGGTAVSLSGGLPSVNAANVGNGDGPIPINQNTGGADNLRYVDSTGNGIEGANVLIYLSTDWPSQPSRVQATAITGSDGRWLSPAFVQSGTYVAVFAKLGADGPDVSAAFSV
ncbi:MAG: hypothetical protein ABSB42_23280 [Tepidisphaeraceae bacterium]|jgi:hypothetical protein